MVLRWTPSSFIDPALNANALPPFSFAFDKLGVFAEGFVVG
jgi:hypothetical protein